MSLHIFWDSYGVIFEQVVPFLHTFLIMLLSYLLFLLNSLFVFSRFVHSSSATNGSCVAPASTSNDNAMYAPSTLLLISSDFH